METVDFKDFCKGETPKEGTFLPKRINLPTLKHDSSDSEMAKDSIRGILQASGHALEELINISMESQSSKHFDSLANLIRALNESSKYLFDMNKEQESIEATTNIQNNTAVFVGSTTELLKMLRKEQGE